jgi:hypothetical protein
VRWASVNRVKAICVAPPIVCRRHPRYARYREITRPIGARLYAETYAGVWCRSAADRTGEEVALFVDEDHAATPTVAAPPRRLWEWFPMLDEWKPS